MSSPRKNFTKGYKIVKDDFNHAVENIFEKQYHGTKCSNPVFINVLFCCERQFKSAAHGRVTSAV